MLTSVVTFYDNETGPSSTASLLYPPPSSAISNRKCRCVQHRHPERPTGVEGSVSSLCSTPPTLSPSNRKSGIRNPNNRCISNHFHFSNRKYSAISCPEARRVRPTFQSKAMPLSQILIETPRLKLRISRPISTTSNFLIETKRRFCIPNASAFRCLLASSSPNLCVSVPPWPIFAIMAGSN